MQMHLFSLTGSLYFPIDLLQRLLRPRCVEAVGRSALCGTHTGSSMQGEGSAPNPTKAALYLMPGLGRPRSACTALSHPAFLVSIPPVRPEASLHPAECELCRFGWEPRTKLWEAKSCRVEAEGSGWAAGLWWVDEKLPSCTKQLFFPPVDAPDNTGSVLRARGSAPGVLGMEKQGGGLRKAAVVCPQQG